MSEHVCCPVCTYEFEDAQLTPRGIFVLNEAPIFSSSNTWGIPDLREDRMATPDCIPTDTYGGDPMSLGKAKGKLLFVHDSCKFPLGARGHVVGFYTSDERFESLWTDAIKSAERLTEVGWAAAIAPNWSIWQDDPLVVQAYNAYRSRFVARLWQELDVNIIPDLNWGDERSYDFAWAGIPENCPVASIQVRTTRSKNGQQRFLDGLQAAVEQVQPEHLIVYGGTEHPEIVKQFSGLAKLHLLPSFTSVRKSRHGLKNRE